MNEPRYTLYITLNWWHPNSAMHLVCLTIAALGDITLGEAEKIWHQAKFQLDGKPEIELLAGVTVIQLRQWFQKFGEDYPTFRVIKSSNYDAARGIARDHGASKITFHATREKPPNPVIGDIYIHDDAMLGDKMSVYDGNDWVVIAL